MKTVVVLISAILANVSLLTCNCYGDSAEVLPKGIIRAAITSDFYFPVEKRYDPDGNEEDLAADLNGDLNSNVFPALRLVELGWGMPEGSANIGNAIVDFEWNFIMTKVYFQYGITDKLSAGVKFQHVDVRNDVKTRLDISGTTVGKNAALNTIAPLTVPGTVPLTEQDVQDFIGDGLDINEDGAIDIPGYGFDPVKRWSNSGLSDIEAGFRYQYFKTDDWRLAFDLGAMIPVGDENDPDSLVDWGISTGLWAIILRLNQDYTGFDKVLLRTSLQYEINLPDEERLRILTDPNEPLARFKEKVDRDVGDIFGFQTVASYKLSKSFSLSLLYKFNYQRKTKISGDMGLDYEPLEAETRRIQHRAKIGVSYSTLSKFLAKEFPIPLVASLTYRNRFAGSGNVNKSEFIQLGLAVYF